MGRFLPEQNAFDLQCYPKNETPYSNDRTCLPLFSKMLVTGILPPPEQVNRIACLGPGSGEELLALSELYPGVKQIDAIDLMPITTSGSEENHPYDHRVVSKFVRDNGYQSTEFKEVLDWSTNHLMRVLNQLAGKVCVKYNFGNYASPEIMDEIAPEADLIIARHPIIINSKPDTIDYFATEQPGWGDWSINDSMLTENKEAIYSWYERSPEGATVVASTLDNLEIQPLLRKFLDEGLQPDQIKLVANNNFYQIGGFDYPLAGLDKNIMAVTHQPS